MQNIVLIVYRCLINVQRNMTSSPSTFMSCNDNSEPPFLAIGTDVSAKYKGAFCEAKIKKVTRLVKCRVTFKNNGGSVIVTDDNIKGSLRVGTLIEAKHPDKNQFLEGTINKIIDASQYTVVFDDGDETTLRRTSLCLKSGKHFAESESLDHLPLTNPEHFGNPVNLGSVKSRRKRNVPIERERRDDTPNSISEERSNDDNDDEDPKKVSSNTAGRKGKKRGKYARKARIRQEAEGQSEEVDAASSVDNNEEKSPPMNADSETESDNEYDSIVSNNNGNNNTNNNNSNNSNYQRDISSAHNEERIKCETESMEASPASGTTESYSSFTSYKSRRKRNPLIDNERKDETTKTESSENNQNDDDEKKVFSGPGRRGKRRGKIGRKRVPKTGPDIDDVDNIDEKPSGANNGSGSESEAEYDSKIPTISREVNVEVDDRIRVKYGKGKVVKIYEAKVVKSDDATDLLKRKYYVHYTGWNTRYDEWIKRNRIVEVIRDKVAKRKGGSKFKKGISLNQRQTNSPDKEESPKEQPKEKDSKDSIAAATKNIPSVKRGRPSSANDAKTADGNKNAPLKGKTHGKRKYRSDQLNTIDQLPESTRIPSPPNNVKNVEHEDSVNANQSDHDASPSINDCSDTSHGPYENEVLCHNANTNDENCKALEESTDIDPMEVAAETELKEEVPKALLINENVEEKVKPLPIPEDILTCNENLAKSPLMRPISPEISDFVRESSKVGIKTEKSSVNSFMTDERESENEDSKSSIRLGKRKLIGKQSFRRDKKQSRSPESEDCSVKNAEDIQGRKKLSRKRKDESNNNNDDESKKEIKSFKKTRKSYALTQELLSTSTVAEVESTEKLKKGISLDQRETNPPETEECSSETFTEKDCTTSITKSISTIKRGRPSSTTESKVTDSSKASSSKGKGPGKRKFRTDHFDTNNQSPEPVRNSSSLSSNVKIIDQEDNAITILSEQEVNLSHATNEFPNASHTNKIVKEFEQNMVLQNENSKSGLEESQDIDLVDLAPVPELKDDTSKSRYMPDITAEEKFKECPVITPEDILTCNENLAKSPPMRPISPELTDLPIRDVPKVDIKPLYCPLPEENESEDEESRFTARLGKRKSISKQSFRKDKKQSRSPESEDYSNRAFGELQTRKKFSRKRKDSHQNDEDELKKEYKSPKKTRKSYAPAQESSSTSNTPETEPIPSYSPNAFVNSVYPTSKYNFCTPIDENFDAEKRIQIIQDRLQDLRKTYMNIKAEVASIERRKKPRKRDKDLNSPISPSSSSHHDHSASRNPKDHPPEIFGTETLPSQTCAA